ncbi:SET domain-containing protein SmydA-8 [Durusdinium trenchii]|uniref:Isoform B n=1 Tax=Durusdinium trenchii TaxID=1381693 RepID=A0ABP0RCL6_9DINO
MENVEVINGYLQSRGSLVQCALTESKGRILVASRDFESGDVIYTEPPLHIIEEDENSELFRQLEQFALVHDLCYSARWCWCALNSLTAGDLEQLPLRCSLISEGLQRQLLWLCAPDENDSAALPAIQQLLLDLGMTTDLTDKFWRLLQVWKYNSFEYSDDPVASAIYLQASFHSHDCNPNSNWVADEQLVLRARRPIAAGEEVTISYLSDEELFEATMERRMRLRISKDFHCLCQRCSEHWDRSRGVRCRCGSLRFLAAEGWEKGKLVMYRKLQK